MHILILSPDLLQQSGNIALGIQPFNYILWASNNHDLIGFSSLFELN